MGIKIITNTTMRTRTMKGIPGCSIIQSLALSNNLTTRGKAVTKQHNITKTIKAATMRGIPTVNIYFPYTNITPAAAPAGTINSRTTVMITMSQGQVLNSQRKITPTIIAPRAVKPNQTLLTRTIAA